MTSGIGERLKMARRLADMSQEAVAEQVGLSKMAISKYESEKVLPSSDVLIRLAEVLHQPIEFFLRGPIASAVTPVYRGGISLHGKHEEMVEAQLQEWLERYLAVESFYPLDELVHFAFPEGFPYPVEAYAEIEDAAEKLRAAWSIGDAPIDNLVELLEDKGIKVGEVSDYVHFDARLFELDGNSPVMAMKAGIAGDRQRFCLAHELGHLMVQETEALHVERVAHRFAGAFLVPRSAAYRELGHRRQTVSMRELQLLQQKYGLSMQAWVYRCRDLGILNEAAAKQHFIHFRRAGMVSQESGDALRREIPQRMTRLILRAIAEDVISPARGAELLGMPLEGTGLDFLEGENPLQIKESSLQWVIDANILFDFAIGGLLDELFRLPMNFCTPDLLIVELQRPSAAQLRQLGLVVLSLNGEQLVEIIALRRQYPALSQPDIATFVLAQKLGIGLLTGERRLREMAHSSGIEVHGTLWLLNELVNHASINYAQACAALEAMIQRGRRLPHAEVATLRLRWGCE